MEAIWKQLDQQAFVFPGSRAALRRIANERPERPCAGFLALRSSLEAIWKRLIGGPQTSAASS
jgi:hypothetical protein